MVPGSVRITDFLTVHLSCQSWLPGVVGTGRAEMLVSSWERNSSSCHTAVRFLPLEHIWRSAWMSGQDVGGHAHVSVGSSSMSPFSYLCLVECHPALGDKSIELCCLWCAAVKLAKDWQVRSDFHILGIIVSLPVSSPGNLQGTLCFQVAFLWETPLAVLC